MTEGLVKQSIAELRDFARCRRYMVDAVQVVADRIEELEAKLAKAVEALEHAKLNMPHPDQMIDDTLAELTGGKNE